MSVPRDAENPGAHYVYRCYAADDTLLYVGCARDVEDRVWHHTHLCNVAKYPNGMLRRHMVRHTATAYPSRLDARAAERAAIQDEAPLFNKQHNPTRWRKGKGGGFSPVDPVHPLIAEAIDLYLGGVA